MAIRVRFLDALLLRPFSSVGKKVPARERLVVAVASVGVIRLAYAPSRIFSQKRVESSEVRSSLMMLAIFLKKEVKDNVITRGCRRSVKSVPCAVELTGFKVYHF